ncbi:MAG: hypothetical protein ACRDOP_04550, partial [Gaiellaceae bacterium]
MREYVDTTLDDLSRNANFEVDTEIARGLRDPAASRAWAPPNHEEASREAALLPILETPRGMNESILSGRAKIPAKRAY